MGRVTGDIRWSRAFRAGFDAGRADFYGSGNWYPAFLRWQDEQNRPIDLADRADRHAHELDQYRSALDAIDEFVHGR